MNTCERLEEKLKRPHDFLERAWRWLGQQRCESTPITGMATVGCYGAAAKWGWKNWETLAGLACGIGVAAASEGAAAGAALVAFRYCAYALVGIDGVRAAKKRYPNFGVLGGVCFTIATYADAKTKLSRLYKKAAELCGTLLDTRAVMGLGHL